MSSQKNQYSFNVKQIDSEGLFSGYASVFDIIDSHNDVIVNGAFGNSLLKNNVKLLWQHQIDSPIGNIVSLKEDSYGLFVEGKLLLDVEKGREAYSLLKSGAINSMSIGYSVKDVEYDDLSGLRYINEVDLFEISLVTFPANESAVVTSVKNEDKQDDSIKDGNINSIRDYEKFLRKNGFSRKEAKEITLYGYKSEEVKSLNDSIDRVVGLLRL